MPPSTRLRTALALGLVAALGAIAVFGAGWFLGKPSHATLGVAPSDLHAESVAIAGGSSDTVRGWFAAGQAGKGAVLLLHGVRANRGAMLSRARFLQREGFGVLLVDLQAHGETRGDHVTFGVLESRDAHAALTYLRSRTPGEKSAVIGVSLGGAAALLGRGPLAVDAAVLEAVYPTIEEATANRLRMRFGRVGLAGTRLLTWQLPLWAGVRPQELRPIDAIRSLRAPVLIVAGAEDQQTPLAESQRMFAAAPEPKELWVVARAGHEDYHAARRAEYEARVGAFLRRYLNSGDVPVLEQVSAATGSLPTCYALRVGPWRRPGFALRVPAQVRLGGEATRAGRTLEPELDYGTGIPRSSTGFSSWRRVAPDSLALRWSDGFAGVEVRVRAQPNGTVHGRATTFSDVVGESRATAPVSGERTACPRASTQPHERSP